MFILCSWIAQAIAYCVGLAFFAEELNQERIFICWWILPKILWIWEHHCQKYTLPKIFHVQKGLLNNVLSGTGCCLQPISSFTINQKKTCNKFLLITPPLFYQHLEKHLKYYNNPSSFPRSGSWDYMCVSENLIAEVYSKKRWFSEGTRHHRRMDLVGRGASYAIGGRGHKHRHRQHHWWEGGGLKMPRTHPDCHRPP